MASLVCARPAFNNIAGLVAGESLSTPLNPQFEASLSRWAFLSVVSHASLRLVSLVTRSRHLGGLSYETVTKYRPAFTYDLATQQRPGT